MKKRTVAKNLLILFMIILFAYLCFSDNGLIEFIKNPSKLNLWWLLVGVLCQIMQITLDGILTYKFLHNINSKITFKNSFACALLGQFYCAITPSATGGQPMQVYFMSKRKVDAGTTTSALTQKFLIYQITLIIYFIFTIIYKTEYLKSVNPAVYLILSFGFVLQVTCLVILIIFSVNKTITSKIIIHVFNFLSKIKIVKNPKEKIDKLKQNIQLFNLGNKYLYNKKVVLQAIALTLFQLTFMFFIPFCVYKSFGFSGHKPLDMICAQSFIVMSSSLFPIPGASGAAEGASSIFLSPYFGEESIKSAIVVIRLVMYYFTIILTAPFAKITKIHDEDKESEYSPHE
ncbi:MAG: flippase-like domain-containing protein [Clostridia bacterium]|nr:flippase-like domain-containing protein [Clostridia bacterium]